jgi:hypothetical protein
MGLGQNPRFLNKQLIPIFKVENHMLSHVPKNFPFSVLVLHFTRPKTISQYLLCGLHSYCAGGIAR